MAQLLSSSPEPHPDFLDAVLESSEFGLAVVDDGSGNAQVYYLNATARRLLDAQPGLPLATPWAAQLTPLLARLERNGDHAVDRWMAGELVLRVHARLLDRARHLVALELSVERSPANGAVADRLVSTLGLSGGDARLLAFLWRGLSNEDIASTLNVRLGTVKSRLFRLYQRLGVSKRSAAVLRAAEVLQESPAPEALHA